MRLAWIVVVLGLVTGAWAGELELKTERVVVFKDGYALFVKSGRAIADSQGRVYTAQVPEAAILGSFWASERAGGGGGGGGGDRPAGRVGRAAAQRAGGAGVRLHRGAAGGQHRAGADA